MDPRNTCISALRLEVRPGHVRIFIQQTGREYLILDEDMLTKSLTLSALQIDHRVSDIDDDALLSKVAEIGAQRA